MLGAVRRSPVLAAHVLLLGVVVVWGTTFTLVKAALENISPLLFNLFRMLLAFAVLAAFSWQKLRSCSRRDLRGGCAAGLFLGLGYQFQTAGLTRTTPTKSAFITGLVVVFVPLLGLIPGVKPPGMPRTRWNAIAGACTAFTGLVLLTTPAHSQSLLSGFGVGEVLTLACALAFAIHLYAIAHLSADMDARRLGALQVGAAAVVMVFTLPLGGHPVLHWNAAILWALLVTSVLATAAAFTIQSWAQKHISPTHAALIFTLEPVFAWLTSLLFFHERLSARSLQGAGLIVSGILLSELWPAPNGNTVAVPIEPTAS